MLCQMEPTSISEVCVSSEETTSQTITPTHYESNNTARNVVGVRGRKKLSAQLTSTSTDDEMEMEMEVEVEPDTRKFTNGQVTPYAMEDTYVDSDIHSPYAPTGSHERTHTPNLSHESTPESTPEGASFAHNDVKPEAQHAREKLDLGFMWAQDRDRFLADRARQQRDMYMCHTREMHDLQIRQHAEVAHWTDYFAYTKRTQWHMSGHERDDTETNVTNEGHEQGGNEADVTDIVQAQYMRDMRMRHESEMHRVVAHHTREVQQWRAYFDGVLCTMEDDTEVACERIVQATASGTNTGDYIVKCGDCRTTLTQDDYFWCQGCKMATCASCKGASCHVCEEELCDGCLGSWEQGCGSCAINDVVRCCELKTMYCGQQECTAHAAQHADHCDCETAGQDRERYTS
ncbi:hypothetical protein SARC_12242 [Sphaeroforma arctica JP610]|uniref:Uncharacterized protein n=1 Tax=Sphaeroforma arctica JP610 TaxID=667725 RepID=A0A0L0FEQ7_9EUKA|nr:hypothetical protein SARC_12242 [Sphaeroforma arctica JP610]KNC75230.1 hypothetical protein SARC_12242 [Sphaeroforma arctica JP610]|eukprot:XP_014149132.1 hypothetical protein SARC_12242 [Sphaeroforma arctica JP610]